jgi:anti-sigma B factor antagonist
MREKNGSLMLDIRIEHRDNIAVLHCSGRIDIGEALTRLREAVICELSARTIVLDLARVTAIDAAGLGLLMFLHTRAASRGCELKLRAPSPQIASVLALTHLDSVLTLRSAAGFDYSRRPPANSSHEHDDEVNCALCREG